MVGVTRGVVQGTAKAILAVLWTTTCPTSNSINLGAPVRARPALPPLTQPSCGGATVPRGRQGASQRPRARTNSTVRRSGTRVVAPTRPRRP